MTKKRVLNELYQIFLILKCQTPGNKAFRGFIANGNKSVIKILGNSFKYDGLAVYMRGLWICGFDAVGKYSSADAKYYYNGNRGGIPNAVYYLVRKDVAEGLELKAPDLSAALQ